MKTQKELVEIGKEIAWHGGWEEYHQKRKEYELYEYHKNIRLKLEEKYRQ